MQSDPPNKKKEIRPRNRQNLTELSDKIFALKSAITFKLNIESQIELQWDLIRCLQKQTLLDRLCKIIFTKSKRLSNTRDKLEIMKLMADNQVKEKLKNTYHGNELLLEDFFKDIYEEMDERFDDYYHRLVHIMENYVDDIEIPYNDVKTLVLKYTQSPPDKTDKLAFYLTMENTLYRCGGGA